jgi:cytochrome c oxidase cbb3-type subunit 3
MCLWVTRLGETRHKACAALLAASLFSLMRGASCQEAQTGDQNGAQPRVTYQNMTPEQRAAATRAFLGLGAVPDKAAAERGAPIYQQTCAFCHGPQARGATGPSLITSDEVLSDDHGEHLVEFLKKGRPEKGMPAYAPMAEEQLKDIAEFLHLQVEEIANRGAYQVQNIVVGNASDGKAYVAAHCMTCHTAEAFAHIGRKFRSAEQLQRGWVWPAHEGDPATAITATVKTPSGEAISGRVTQVSDFRITLVDAAGQTRAIDLGPGVEVRMNNPLAAHEALILTLRNDDMHNVTAYLNSLKDTLK